MGARLEAHEAEGPWGEAPGSSAAPAHLRAEADPCAGCQALQWRAWYLRATCAHGVEYGQIGCERRRGRRGRP